MSQAVRVAAVDEALARLVGARRSSQPCAPVRDLLGADAGDDAYAVQSAWVAERVAAGARVVGRKIGLTNPAVQRQLGVDSPDFGVLLGDMRVDDGGVCAVPLLQPRIEAELAFVLAGDLDGDADEDAVRAATATVHAALEIVDSRIAGWDIRLVDTVADNASAAAFVLGAAAPLPDDPAAIAMTMDRGGERVSAGVGADCLGSPLTAVVWLARTAAAQGDPLRAGDIVLSGALGPVVPVRPGDAFRAELTGVGTVSVAFGGAA